MAILRRLASRAAPAAAALLLLPAAGGGTTALTEAQVKAGLLYNFATFIEWPDSRAAAQLPFEVCVSGADDVVEALRAVEGQLVRGRRLVVRPVAAERDVRACHVLYLSGSSADAARVLADLKHTHVLTVGEHEQFSRMGGIIRLFPERSRIRFEIDVARAERSGLRISSKLLGLARLLRDGNVVQR
jgi:hypothetical protein